MKIGDKMVTESKILEHGIKKYAAIKYEWDNIMDNSKNGWLKRNDDLDEDEVYAQQYLKKKGFDWFFDKMAEGDTNLIEEGDMFNDNMFGDIIDERDERLRKEAKKLTKKQIKELLIKERLKKIRRY